MSVSSYQILVVDDSKRDILLLERTLQQAEDATPVIMLTAFGQNRLPVAAMQAGALDYFAKAQVSLSLLNQAIIQAIETARLQVQAARPMPPALEHSKRWWRNFSSSSISRVAHDGVIRVACKRWERFALWDGTLCTKISSWLQVEVHGQMQRWHMRRPLLHAPAAPYAF